ncbi:hypothetical protein [Deinococcus radiotolerans]|uniref:Uncharacterized protein n=1 Tax=Deinococcus radiotolerans TaxID=1309407 RepID=A0ABQ2FRS6_9DEIO|nr:hypothetical protein [Deinococcus radiotolerans]GGL20503.1 hypothetical protein GCM10010844_44200 [Deinococcus radiotolerans]
MRLFIRGLVRPKDLADASLAAADTSDDVFTFTSEGPGQDGYVGTTLTFIGERNAALRFRSVWKTEMERCGYHVELR